MKILKKVLVLFLIPSVLVMFFPRVLRAEEASYYAQADIQKHTPEVLSMPEEEMPTEKEVKPARKWPWVLLGLVIVGGVLALAGSGGGGGGGGGGTSSSTGNVSVGW